MDVSGSTTRDGAAAPSPAASSGAASAGRPGPGLGLALMVTAQFMVILDAAIVNVALPTIQRSLGFSAVGVEGVITAYATAFGGVLILGGRLCDLFGGRRMFVIGLAAFGVTSLACALATSPVFLVVARVAQGLGAGVLAPAALALLTTTFTEGASRNRALGVFGVATSLGFVTGQVLGGVLADTVGWRAVFIINVPVAAIALLLVPKAVRPDGPPATRQMPDVFGAVLITAAIAIMVWAPTQGAQHGWGSASFLVPLVVSFAMLGIFGVVEARRRDPLVRLAMLRSRWLAGANAATAVTGALNGAALLLCTLFLQQAHGYTPLQAGLAFLPTGLAGLIVGARAAGPLITRLGVRTVLTGASVVSAVMIFGVSFLAGNGNYLPLLGWLIGIGASFTTAAVATTVATSSGVAWQEQGMAAGLRQTSFQIGVALGVAVFLSVAASHASALLAGASNLSRPEALTAGFRLSLQALSVLSLLGAIVAWATLHRKKA
jgi:EmrB/QacA subfamily drug resistance transporter